MSSPGQTEGVVDHRAQAILDGLRQGLTRDQLAEKFGHKGRQAIDQFMRRRHFVWSEPHQTYVKSKTHPEWQTGERVIPAKASRILLEFRSINADAREIARRLGFKDHREMASYMRENGFTWSTNHHNYIQSQATQAPKEETRTTGQPPVGTASHQELPTTAQYAHHQVPFEWAQLFPMLQMLHENRDRLVTLIEQTPPRALTVPRYNVGGGYINKALNMHAAIEELVRDFSNEKTIHQREVFEVALIQFFYRYGYGKRVDALLSHDA